MQPLRCVQFLQTKLELDLRELKDELQTSRNQAAEYRAMLEDEERKEGKIDQV